jgi:DNA-binding NarL/FixJ family response regulator
MRVVLADDQPKVRSALRLLLEYGPKLSVVGEAAEARELLEQIEAGRPELVLLDWELPGLKFMDLMPRLRQHCPDLKIIVLSSRPEANKSALSAGADGFVSKGDSPERLLEVVIDQLRSFEERKGSA